MCIGCPKEFCGIQADAVELDDCIPIACRDGSFHICNGRFGNLTHTGTVEIEAIVELKVGLQCCIKRPELPQNQGPSSTIVDMSSWLSKSITKNPRAHG